MYWLTKFCNINRYYTELSSGTKKTFVISEYLLPLTNYDTVCNFNHAIYNKLYLAD